MKKPGSDKNDASILIGESEIMAIHMVETETYPFSSFVSDAGGAGGLFLGLSLLSIFFVIFIFLIYFKYQGIYSLMVKGVENVQLAWRMSRWGMVIEKTQF